MQLESTAPGQGAVLSIYAKTIQLAAKGCDETRGRRPRMKPGGHKASDEAKGAQRPKHGLVI